MKQLSILLLGFILFACDKKDVDADLAEQIKGNYEVYYIKVGSEEMYLPYYGVTAGLKFVRLTNNSTKSFLTTSFPDGSSQSGEEDLTLKRNGIHIELYDDNKMLVGYVTSGLIEMNYVEPDGKRYVIKARK